MIRKLTTAALLALAACDEVPRSVSDAVAGGVQQARSELAERNISISSDDLPKAEITPDGTLVIEGRRIAATPEQRELLRRYRDRLLEMAGEGVEIGAQGAALGAKAAGEALRGLLSGDTDAVEARIDAEAAKIEQAATGLCALMPELLDAQQRLADAMPAFRPYATLDQDEVDECGRK